MAIADNIIKLQLYKIGKIAEEKQNQLDKEQYEKYFPIFEIAYKILKTQPVLLYGGMAINEMLPAKMKIYKENVLPDIDVFSKNAKDVAKKIVAAFKKKGHLIASFGDALHDGTYKVYVHGLQVIDITNISSAAFKALSYESTRSNIGIKIVNPQFIRMSLHMMLSQPNDAHRWDKTFQRLVLFYKLYPPKKCQSKVITASSDTQNTNANANTNANINTELEDVTQEIYSYIKNTEFLVFGMNEIKEFFKGHDKEIPKLQAPLIQVLVKEDVVEVATDILEKIGNPKLKISQIFEPDDFISRHVFIYYGKTKIVGLYTANSCVSFINYLGYRFATIHTVLRMYMLMLFSKYAHFQKDHDNIECLVNLLSVIQYKKIGSKNKLFKEFTMDCYGMHKGLITLKRERLQRFAK